MSTRDLLIEIGTEELPPKALKRLSEAFTKGIVEGLGKAELDFSSQRSYAAPRRLAVLLTDLVAQQSDREVERRGPALTSAFDEMGQPTKACQGFARSCGVDVSELEKLETDKGCWLVYRSQQEGRPATELIPDIVRNSLDKLPIPKRMRWGALDSEFVRPVHWVVLLFGNEVIETEILSVKSGRETRGHRFHCPHNLYIGEPAAYAPLLETEGKVVADFADRREAIRAQVLEAASRLGGQAVLDEDLLDEVTALVEWPSAVFGGFERRFLAVPAEALISTMKGNQKYFPVVDSQGKLMPWFITISNIESRDVAQVRAGNERVVRPRLTDAEFFWNQDRKRPLAERREQLASVVFQTKLGSIADKQARVETLACTIANLIGGDPELAGRAAQLAKCDLLTEMVGEFPELQGIMGRYYAAHDNESPEVAEALDEQYMPRFAGDQLPITPTGQALAIADRLDTLVGIFGINQPPTGDKDPFGLRRSTLGVLRILIEKGLDLDLPTLLRQAAEGQQKQGITLLDGVVEQVFDFMLERLRGYFHDSGIALDTFESVLAKRPGQPLDFDRRVRAVSTFRQLPEAEALATANKRIGNILRQAHEGGIAVATTIESARLVEPQELALAKAMAALTTEVDGLFAERNYEAALLRLATLRGPIDAFFDAVMVMAEDPAVRANRLALLKQLSELFLQAADISRLQG